MGENDLSHRAGNEDTFVGHNGSKRVHERTRDVCGKLLDTSPVGRGNGFVTLIYGKSENYLVLPNLDKGERVRARV